MAQLAAAGARQRRGARIAQLSQRGCGGASDDWLDSGARRGCALDIGFNSPAAARLPAALARSSERRSAPRDRGARPAAPLVTARPVAPRRTLLCRRDSRLSRSVALRDASLPAHPAAVRHARWCGQRSRATFSAVGGAAPLNDRRQGKTHRAARPGQAAPQKREEKREPPLTKEKRRGSPRSQKQRSHAVGAFPESNVLVAQRASRRLLQSSLLIAQSHCRQREGCYSRMKNHTSS